MKNLIEERISGLRGRYGVYIENLLSGGKLEVIKGQESDVFEAASIIKLWIMSAAYEAASRGSLDLDQKIVIKSGDMVPEPGFPDYRRDRLEGHLTEDMFPESGVLNYLHPGLEVTVEDVLKLMILISDNTASNIMIDILGKDAINDHIRSLGMTGTVLKRKLFEPVPEGEYRENVFSLEECAEWLRRLCRGELVSAEYDERMCAILQNQQNTYKLPFYIRSLPIAHKTGEDSGIENDVGIVFSDEPFIFCFASNEADEPEAVRACQDLGALAYSEISKL